MTSPAPRDPRGRRALALLPLAFLLLSPAAVPAAPKLFPPFRPGTSGPAHLTIDRGVPVLHAYGSHAEMGAQIGELLAPQIAFLLEEYVSEIANEETREKLMPSVKGIEFRLPRGLRDEMKAMAAAAGVDYDMILLSNCLIDLKPLIACSTLTLMPTRTTAGELMMGRNLDWFGLNIVDAADVLIVYHADGDRPAVASVTWPGAVGLTTGMNEHGLTVAMLVSIMSQPLISGLPSTLAFREMIGRVERVEDVAPFFDNHRVLLPTNLSVADAREDARVVELNPYTGTSVREPKDGFLVCTNTFATSAQFDPSRDPRFSRLTQAAESAGRHSFLDLRGYLGEVVPGGDWGIDNLQAMILMPKSRTIYLSVSPPPAAKGKFLKFDVGALFAVSPSGGAATPPEK